ncbi:MAG: hypothetical protein MUC99_01030 [Anaerolineae bacterium]|jgi:hypothetical protein|nr:hypothetical protein [Anaerolineae bacterium]
MAIDFTIDYPCAPKEALSTQGIIDRLKGEARAHAIIKLFRDAGDTRSPDQMGFEFTRSTPDGVEENRVIVVQELLDAALDLKPFEASCAGCPANRNGKRFGCIGHIEYPLSGQGEAWMLDQLPPPDDTLVWLLLKKGVEEFDYDGKTVEVLRAQTESYFEDSAPAVRALGEFMINANQVFEMLFVLRDGAIYPNHAGILLLFMGAMRRDIEADELMRLTPAASDSGERFPFRLVDDPADDATTTQLKDFLRALWLGWRLNVRVLTDV